MSTYGSNTRLNTIGPRSGSRQDLSSSFRNDVFAGGNGFHGDFQAADGGAYAYSSTFSRTSMPGGGLGGQKVSMGVSPGGAIRYKLHLEFKLNPKITHLLLCAAFTIASELKVLDLQAQTFDSLLFFSGI